MYLPSSQVNPPLRGLESGQKQKTWVTGSQMHTCNRKPQIMNAFTNEKEYEFY